MKERAIRVRQYSQISGVHTIPSHIENMEARLALAIIEKHAVIAAEPDGYDANGRQKMKLQSEEVVVKRAFNIAKLAMQEIHKRNLFIEIEDEIKGEGE